MFWSQTAPEAQVVPQQGCPGLPQAVHIPPEQVNPVPQAEPAQHGSPLPPQATQLP